MSSITTPNMGMTVPGVLSEPGPDYAVEINGDLSILDVHDHTTGKGVKVPVAGLNINADLPMGENNVNNARSYRMFDSGSNLSGGSDIDCIYVFAGDLWYNNSVGTQVQITNGANLGTQSPTLTEQSVSGNFTIDASDTFNYLRVDSTGGALTITFPSVALVAQGRLYYIKDIGDDFQTNNVTLIRNGSDTFDGVSANRVLDTNLGGYLIVGDGTGNWDIFYNSTKELADGQFGTSINNTTLFGNTVTISAVGSNTISIGQGSNVVGISGATLNIAESSALNITAPTINIGSLTNITNIGSNGTGHLYVKNPASFTGTVSTGGSLTVTGDIDLTGTVTAVGDITGVDGNFHGDIFVTGDATISSNSANAVLIRGTSTFTSPIIIQANTSFDSVLSGVGTHSYYTGRYVPRTAFVNSAVNATYSPSLGNDVVIALTASGVFTWTLSATNAVNGDVIIIVNMSGLGMVVHNGGVSGGDLVGGGGSPTTTHAQFTFRFNGSTGDWIWPEHP